MKNDPINIEITGAEWTLVSLPIGKTCVAYMATSRGQKDFLLKAPHNTLDTPYFTVFSGSSFSIEEAHGVAGMPLFFAKSKVTNDTLEVIFTE